MRLALEEGTRERAPLMWATMQHILGQVLMALAKEEKNFAMVEQAVEAFARHLRSEIVEGRSTGIGWALNTTWRFKCWKGKRRLGGNVTARPRETISAAGWRLGVAHPHRESELFPVPEAILTRTVRLSCPQAQPVRAAV